MTLTQDQFLLYVSILGIVVLPIFIFCTVMWDNVYRIKNRRCRVRCRMCGMRYYGDGVANIQTCPHCAAKTLKGHWKR